MVAETMPDGLVGVLMRVPQGAAEHLSVRLARTSRRTERESVVNLAKAVGAPCVRYLKESLKNDAPAKAATVIGCSAASILQPWTNFCRAASATRPRFPRCRRAPAFHRRSSRARQAPHRFAGNVRRDDSSLALDEIGMCGDGDTAPNSCALPKAKYCRKARLPPRESHRSARPHARPAAAATSVASSKSAKPSVGFTGRNSHGRSTGALKLDPPGFKNSCRSQVWMQRSFNSRRSMPSRTRFRASSPLPPRPPPGNVPPW